MRLNHVELLYAFLQRSWANYLWIRGATCGQATYRGGCWRPGSLQGRLLIARAPAGAAARGQVACGHSPTGRPPVAMRPGAPAVGSLVGRLTFGHKGGRLRPRAPTKAARASTTPA
ncbi:hypothetical protein BHM03_00059285 [Ensete ventricosum]|nr:hypothetical protein BHM03_00059285 [Ensete ventricosum]